MDPLDAVFATTNLGVVPNTTDAKCQEQKGYPKAMISFISATNRPPKPEVPSFLAGHDVTPVETTWTCDTGGFDARARLTVGGRLKALRCLPVCGSATRRKLQTCRSRLERLNCLWRRRAGAPARYSHRETPAAKGPVQVLLYLGQVQNLGAQEQIRAGAQHQQSNFLFRRRVNPKLTSKTVVFAG